MSYRSSQESSIKVLKKYFFLLRVKIIRKR
jgi:hypothetical protein